MTYAEQFVKDNIIFDNGKDGRPRRAYILLRGCNHFDAEDPCKKLLAPGITRKFKWDPALMIISFECRVRFANALRAVKDNNLPRMFIILNQMFSVDSIKRFFYKVWLEWNNVSMRKQNATDECRRNHLIKLGKLRRDEDHIDIMRSTSNMSIREAARRSRNF